MTGVSAQAVVQQALTDQGFEAYPKAQCDKFYLAFRNTESDTFVVTSLAKINDGPLVKYRLQLTGGNKVTFKVGVMSKTKSFYAFKVGFNGCYHDGDGEIVVDMNLFRIFNLSQEESQQVIEHPKFKHQSIQVPVCMRVEDGRVYLLFDSLFDFEVLDADKEYHCFSRIKKPHWRNF
ncbi:MAG TPA: hypothetical protein EYQ43_08855 [Methyloprofundus sp.]|nr:hypothetical protein [Methyloprofundus sp.]